MNKMLNEDGIKNAVIDRLKAMTDSCNHTMIMHNDGVIRGLIWTLTGKDPGTNLSEDTTKILDMLKIKYMEDHNGMLHFL